MSETTNNMVMQQDSSNSQVTAMPQVATEQPLIADNYDYEKQIAALTPQQKEYYLEISKSIDINKPASVQDYGMELSNIVARNGDMLLSSVKSDNSIEVVKYINDLTVELDDFGQDLAGYEDQLNSSFKQFLYSLPLFRRFKKTLKGVMVQYTDVSTNVNKIAEKINTAKLIAMRDNSTLQQIFENNIIYIKQIRDLVIGAKLQLNNIDDDIERKKNDGQTETIIIQQMQNFRNRLEKRITDLNVTAYVFTQNLFQLEAIKENNNAIAEKSNNIVNHVIPIWKSQLPIAIILKNQKASIEAQQKISETTNKLLLKTSKDLKTQSVQVAKASEEAIIDMKTLQQTTKDLIDTINEVKKIHDESSKSRKEIETHLNEYANQLLTSVNSGDGKIGTDKKKLVGFIN